jgi:predicted SAM-dependent methyltransferase
MKNIIIGAGTTVYEGWISTQEQELNLLDRNSFLDLFKEDETVDAFLAEHVFEHLTLEEAVIAAKNLFQSLKPGGYARIAVPDVNFRNPWYHNMCKPGGPGPVDHPAYTHQVFYDYLSLQVVFEKAGFTVDLLEYCDEAGRFHFNYWDSQMGMIGRSLRFDTRNNNGKLGMVSLIIDAVKS